MNQLLRHDPFPIYSNSLHLFEILARGAANYGVDGKNMKAAGGGLTGARRRGQKRKGAGNGGKELLCSEWLWGNLYFIHCHY